MMPLKRLYEFVDYHIHGDGECNGIVLKSWANTHELSLEDRADLCYFFAITYCVESAIVMYFARDLILQNPIAWARENKKKIVFQSDRKYIKMLDAFEKCTSFWVNHREDILHISLQEPFDLTLLIPIVEKWEYFGRFSAYLFLETVAQVFNCTVLNADMDWEHGNTATSGLLNLYGYDKFANQFDKTQKLPEGFTQERMQRMVEPVLNMIEKNGGNANITFVETSLCAYRKFFKGSRYNGYYLDRMLEEIIEMQNNFPQISKELLELRASLFDVKYLGEISGWSGIRKECKKLYKEQGIIL